MWLTIKILGAYRTRHMIQKKRTNTDNGTVICDDIWNIIIRYIYSNIKCIQLIELQTFRSVALTNNFMRRLVLNLHSFKTKANLKCNRFKLISRVKLCSCIQLEDEFLTHQIKETFDGPSSWVEFGRLLRSIASESVVTPLYLCNTKHIFFNPCTKQLCLQTTLVQEKYEMSLKEYISNSYVNIYNKIENVILQLLHVLYELHSNNLTHGNITHSRIFVHKDTIKLTDLNYCIMQGKSIKTPSRIPPEAIKCKFGNFTDMWALGELIFEMSSNFNRYQEDIQLPIWMQNTKIETLFLRLCDYDYRKRINVEQALSIMNKTIIKKPIREYTKRKIESGLWCKVVRWLFMIASEYNIPQQLLCMVSNMLHTIPNIDTFNLQKYSICCLHLSLAFYNTILFDLEELKILCSNKYDKKDLWLTITDILERFDMSLVEFSMSFPVYVTQFANTIYYIILSSQCALIFGLQDTIHAYRDIVSIINNKQIAIQRYETFTRIIDIIRKFEFEDKFMDPGKSVITGILAKCEKRLIY